jgi:hypothetical protein
MASSAQIGPDVQTPPILSKPLVRKYDRRGEANRLKAKTQAKRKPLHEKHLSRNYAAKLFHEIPVREHILELLASKDARLRFEVLRYLWDRLEGKPFVAINPNDNKAPNTLLQDNRIQVAIQQLVPAKQARKSKKAKQIEANSEAKQLAAGDQAEQTYVDAAAQVVDSAGGTGE